MYKVDATGIQLLLGYSDVFGEPAPNLIEEIGKINMHKTLSIIAELIGIRNVKLNPIRSFYCEISIPFEMAIKKEILGIDERLVNGLPSNPVYRKDWHIISLQMFLIFLKKILIYGDYSTLSKTDYSITKEDYAQIIRLQLVVADEVEEKNKAEFDEGHFLYSTYHLNNQPSVAGRILRMYYMLGNLCKDKTNFAADVQGEYRDYPAAFLEKYGVSITQYMAFLLWELQPYDSSNNRLNYFSVWRNIKAIYKSSVNCDLLLKTLSSLSAKPEDLHEWAVHTENEEWNFEGFQRAPFLLDGKGNYLSISDYTLSNAFFEKLYWLIRDCYSTEDSRAMAFYGRLYERYIQDLTREAAQTTYTYIDEFLIGKRGHEAKSSDAYLQKENKLLAVEAKGFSVLSKVMACNKDVEKNNQKLFICPILEADSFAQKAIQPGEKFSEIEEIYVVAVSMDSINANPYYYEGIIKEIEKKKGCARVKYYFNFNVEEYEMLMSVVEKGIDIFSLLKEYFEESTLPPFSNYLRGKGLKPEMTSFMNGWYKQATEEMAVFLRSNEENQVGD